MGGGEQTIRYVASRCGGELELFLSDPNLNVGDLSGLVVFMAFLRPNISQVVMSRSCGLIKVHILQ